MGLIILDHPKLETENTFEYRDFVSSAGIYVSTVLQEKIKNTGFLIAGNGSIGNPIAMMLARSGAENIIIADPESIETSNLARQSYIRPSRKTRLKWLEKHSFNNPAQFDDKSVPIGITNENVESLVSEADIIVDGIDILFFRWDLVTSQTCKF